MSALAIFPSMHSNRKCDGRLHVPDIGAAVYPQWHPVTLREERSILGWGLVAERSAAAEGAINQEFQVFSTSRLDLLDFPTSLLSLLSFISRLV
jgi:hypothetical protein